MKTGNLFVQDLGKSVHANFKLAGSLLELGVLLGECLVLCIEEEDLGKSLVGERAGHDERGMAGGASQIDKTTFSQENDAAAILHVVAVDLGLDGNNFLGVGLEPGDVDLAVEVTNVLKMIRKLAQSLDIEAGYVLQTMESSFMTSKCFAVKISVHPVVVTKIWP